MSNENTTTYETIWRNKWLTSEAQSIDNMIETLTAAVEELKEMKQDGLEGEFDGAVDDYIFFYTKDPVKAQKYGMNEMENHEDGDDEDCCEDGDCCDED